MTEADQEAERAAATQAILAAAAPNKVIVAGAGTGKSFTFRRVLEGRDGDCLALTFINNLADDLRTDLEGLATASTFHAYAKQQLHIDPGDGLSAKFQYYPRLNEVVKEDAGILNVDLGNIDSAFFNLIGDERIPFALGRGGYYDAVGHNDAVYRVLDQYASGKRTVPTYKQIVVDEYQDFNRLEASFIDQLRTKSPVLIVGDDDQAIYDFKGGTPEFIRRIAGSEDFERFELPFCSRCTAVLVDAVHDVVNTAQGAGFLADRVNKHYHCYLPDKGDESEAFPQITHAHCSIQGNGTRNYVGRYLASEIRAIPQETWKLAATAGYPAVLVIGPKHYLRFVHDWLQDEFPGMARIMQGPDAVPRILDGYRILAQRPESNLGWRLVVDAEHSHLLDDVVRESATGGAPIHELLPNDCRVSINEVIALVAAIGQGDDLSEDEQERLVSLFEMPWDELQTAIVGNHPKPEGVSPISLTTFHGCKGMSAAYVFKWLE